MNNSHVIKSFPASFSDSIFKRIYPSVTARHAVFATWLSKLLNRVNICIYPCKLLQCYFYTFYTLLWTFFFILYCGVLIFILIILITCLCKIFVCIVDNKTLLLCHILKICATCQLQSQFMIIFLPPSVRFWFS